ncbi:MAG: hypothetical protein JSS10_09155 [Verrucomicrobia bacterium]|nr:hypothetical protein [Verrucomicrobiota bacterium]
MTAHLCKLGHGLAAVATTTLVAVPASLAVLSVATLAARGLSYLTGKDFTKPEKGNHQYNPLTVLTDFESMTLAKWAAGSAVFAIAAYKGAACCHWGKHALTNSSWLLRNVLPIQLAAPTFFGFRP